MDYIRQFKEWQHYFDDYFNLNNSRGMIMRQIFFALIALLFIKKVEKALSNFAKAAAMP
jgi:hypothetical protein